ncbi:MAG: hypothetical protein ACK4L8_16940 [Nitrincola lacisaponensis]|uniref:hypothetical protein n=1 Tax=Nitrincola lacisaponensis TaxID=267850 RepID=UPI00391B3266
MVTIAGLAVTQRKWRSRTAASRVEMRDNPALRDIPIAIGGSVEQRGVVATRTLWQY